MMLLQDKVALITGGGRGIGKAIALAYAGAGADVVLVSRTRAELEAVAGEVRSRGRQAWPVVADVSVPAEVDHMVEAALAKFGRIDILVNNAAVTQPKSVLDTSLDDWYALLKVNLTGVFLCIQAALKPMVEQRQGHIINIASGSGFRGSPGNAAYSATKAGVAVFTMSLAGEVRDLGIRANVISPGPIKTEMLASRPASAASTTDASNFLEPEDVAGAALYLASPLSGHITGQVIHVRNSSRW
jgi:3-oxoacyl-[acyl-carrier protein] reductase